MNDAELQRLHASVFDRDDELRDECPGEEVLADLIGGTIEVRLETEVTAHLTECISCRNRVEELDAAGAWFESRKEDLRKQVQARLDSGTETCPSAALLRTLAGGQVPRTRAGDGLRERLDQHVAGCMRCQGIHAMRMTIQRALDAGIASVDEAVARILAGLHEIASRVAPVAVPGYRAVPGSMLGALVFDGDGLLLLDADGQPVVVRFDVVRAELSDDGRLVLDLSTADRAYWKSDERSFVVAASIEHESTQVVLPDEEILGEGRVTIIAQLVPGFALKQLPTEAIVIALVRQ